MVEWMVKSMVAMMVDHLESMMVEMKEL